MYSISSTIAFLQLGLRSSSANELGSSELTTQLHCNQCPWHEPDRRCWSKDVVGPPELKPGILVVVSVQAVAIFS